MTRFDDIFSKIDEAGNKKKEIRVEFDLNIDVQNESKIDENRLILTRRVDKNDKTLNTLEESKTDIEYSIKKYDDQISILKNELKQNEEKLNVLNKEKEDALQDKEKEIKEKEKIIEELTLAIYNKNKEQLNSKEDREALQEQVDRLKKQIEENEDSKNELRILFEAKNEEIEDLNSKINNLKLIISDTTEEQITFKFAKEELEKMRREIEDENNSLKNLIEELEDKYKFLLEETAHYKDEISEKDHIIQKHIEEKGMWQEKERQIQKYIKDTETILNEKDEIIQKQIQDKEAILQDSEEQLKKYIEDKKQILQQNKSLASELSQAKAKQYDSEKRINIITSTRNNIGKSYYSNQIARYLSKRKKTLLIDFGKNNSINLGELYIVDSREENQKYFDFLDLISSGDFEIEKIEKSFIKISENLYIATNSLLFRSDYLQDANSKNIYNNLYKLSKVYNLVIDLNCYNQALLEELLELDCNKILVVENDIYTLHTTIDRLTFSKEKLYQNWIVMFNKYKNNKIFSDILEQKIDICEIRYLRTKEDLC